MDSIARVVPFLFRQPHHQRQCPQVVTRSVAEQPQAHRTRSVHRQARQARALQSATHFRPVANPIATPDKAHQTHLELNLVDRLPHLVVLVRLHLHRLVSHKVAAWAAITTTLCRTNPTPTNRQTRLVRRLLLGVLLPSLRAAHLVEHPVVHRLGSHHRQAA